MPLTCCDNRYIRFNLFPPFGMERRFAVSRAQDESMSYRSACDQDGDLLRQRLWHSAEVLARHIRLFLPGRYRITRIAIKGIH